MYNCYRLFFHDRMIAIFHSYSQCEAYIDMCVERYNNQSKDDYTFEGVYIEGVRF